MSNTKLGKFIHRSPAFVLATLLLFARASCEAAATTQESQNMTSTVLNVCQQAIVPIAAFASEGNLTKLHNALNEGLDAGLTVSDEREILIQVYAYAGFPRSLNALSELMKVLDARKQRGIQDAPGQAPKNSIPTGEALRAAGTANQTKLAGGPVKGPLFEFAPAIDEYLKTHLFGDIFERDNFAWQSREIATVAMLSALPGAEPQVQAHIRISMNVGISESQLSQLSKILTDRVGADTGRRAREALQRHLASVAGR